MRRAVSLMVAAVVAISAIAAFAWQQQRPIPKAVPPVPSATPAAAAPPIAVDVHTVRPEPFQVDIQATGTLLPRESVELVSELSRRLVRVRAEEGTVVKKGAVLFELDSSDLHAELNKLDVQTRLAKATLSRIEKLSAEGLSTGQELETAQARVEDVEAQRRVIGVTLAKTVIRAPFAGKLGLRRVSEGAWLSPSTVLTTLQDTSTLKLDFTLPERYGGALGSGAEFRFKVAGNGETFTGKVAAQEPGVDASTRSVLVRGLVENHPELMPGTFASVELPLRVEEALLVPAISVLPGVEGRRVFVARDGVAHSVPVQVGTRTADRVQIVSGLSAGDQVITSNLLRVRDRAKVRVTPAKQP